MTRSGLILDDRYQLDERIAAGGVGQVWRARDLLLSRPVAVKVLRPEYADHPDTLDRFRKEAMHAGALSHPNIAQVYDYGHDRAAGSPYLVLELVDGPSLADVLAVDPVEPAFALDVIAQVAEGLYAAHRAGLVHRDVKPANILIAADGRVKVTDFGIAHAAGQTPVTGPGLVMGTALYMAPERIAGTPGSPASDLYALGIVLHECLTGMPPYEGSPADIMGAHLYRPLPPLPPQVPSDIEFLVTQLTVKDPDKRLSDARDVAAQAVRLRDAVLTGGLVPFARNARHSTDLQLADATTAAPAAASATGAPSVAAPSVAAPAAPAAAPAGSDTAGSRLAVANAPLFESGWVDPHSSGGNGRNDLTPPPVPPLPTSPAGLDGLFRPGTPAAADETAARYRRRRATAYAAGVVLLAGVVGGGLVVSGALRSAPAADRLTGGSSPAGAPLSGSSSPGSTPGSAAGTGTGTGGGGVIGPNGTSQSATTRAGATGGAQGSNSPGATESGAVPSAGPSLLPTSEPITGPVTGPASGPSTGPTTEPVPGPTTGAPATTQPPGQSPSPVPTASATPTPTDSPTSAPTDTPTPTPPASTSPAPAPTSPTPTGPVVPTSSPTCILGICLPGDLS